MQRVRKLRAACPQPAWSPHAPHPHTTLGALRVGVGALSLAAPGLSARVFGRDPRRTDPWLLRLFASRELALAGALLASRGERLRAVALLGAAIDGVDVASSAVEYAQGRMSTSTAISGGGGAALFTVLGLLIAREEA